MPPSTLPLLGVAAFLLIGAPAFGRDNAPPEPWADPGLKVTRGLALWLDAGRINPARKARSLDEAHDGTKLGVWHDASGHGRHFIQRRESAQPAYFDGAVRFDGEATSLECACQTIRIQDFTLFVVAAPLSNSSGFRAFMAMRQGDQNDYASGVTVDMGSDFSGRFASLNVEGKGFGGMLNLMSDASDFGVVRRMTIASSPGLTSLFVDGKPARSRERTASVMDIDRMVVGARHFGFPPSIRGFLDGDVAQILVYDRVLDPAEREDVERYLADRLGGKDHLVRPARPGVGRPLITVKNPPPVQMLVPGFSARELPVDLPNVNNVKYRHDGELVALAYDGNIDLLSDKDGDGLEETAERFWENKGSLVAPIGMALTPRDYALGDGVFVASKGKVSLIVDVDRDGKADREIVVARGWKELPHGVDALGVALDAQGNVYFGLGTTDFTNAYRVGADGKASYDLKDEHGTIQKVAPDFSTREIVATGIRFPVALAFNRLGDLFATDQEGATWLPNGNPFDELLHVRSERHYGFPPRHPTHLPSVIDEPSVFDYTPQHQSTCGLNFNEPVNGGPTFGPSRWAGDALVTGYSRGKLFRTKLAKTPAGYVAQNHLLGVLNRLAVDACVSPQGDLVVATHGGMPDWGSGPKGKGTLLKIRAGDRDTPLPVLAWASGPQEVRVAFDRPLDPSLLKDLARKASIEYGRSARPGDRFESLRPGYEVVARQMASPRFDLPILSAQVSGDRRSLVLNTAPHPEASSYAITLPGPAPRSRAGELPQVAEVDLGYDLSGVEATWTPEVGEGRWSVWLPHPDLAVARDFTAGSAEHDLLWKAVESPGRLALKFKLDLWQMLRPAVQPGSTIDYRLPEEEVALVVSGSGPIEIKTPGGCSTLDVGEDGRQRVAMTVTPREGVPIPVEILLKAAGKTSLDITWTTREDTRPRALPLRRFLLPWASLEKAADAMAEREVPELKGGDWARGRAIFHGEQAKCSSCHRTRGRGREIGPDLSNLIHRDYGSVYRDIHSPSAAINPDFLASTVALTDGRVLQGTLRTDGDRVIVADTAGRLTAVGRAEIESTSPSPTSIMPEGLDVALGAEKLRDLLTYLLTDPLRPADPGREGAPPPRRRAEIDAVIKAGAPVPNPKPLRIVLSAGPKDHGPGEHDYPLWLERWSALLATDPSVTVESAEGWPGSRRLDAADVVVVYSNNPGWDASKAEELDRFLARGGGLVLIHYAVDGHDAVGTLADRIGLAWQGGKSAFRHGVLDVDFSKSTHPIARGFDKLRLVDESYWNLVGDPSSVDMVGSGVEDGRPRPLFWTRQTGKGRVFVSIPGHFTWTFDDPLFRLLLLRGMAWSAGVPIDRFNGLTTLGARISD